MKKYNIFFISLIFCLFACEKEIAFNGGEVEPKLTLNCLLSPSGILVHLSESRFFLSNQQDFKTVQGAAVTLWKNGEAIETLTDIGRGYYTAHYLPITGDKLKLTAAASGLNPVECSTEILPAAEILSVDTVKSRNDYFDYDLTVRFKDAAETDDYYRIDMYIRDYYADGSYRDIPMHYESNDVVFSSTNGNPLATNENYYYVFTDALFNGKEYNLKVQMRADEPGGTKEYVPARELHVDLQHITKDYYLYLKSRGSVRGDESGGMFTEPVQVYNNIKGGIGILGSYTSTVYKVSLRTTNS